MWEKESNIGIKTEQLIVPFREDSSTKESDKPK